MRSRTRRFLNGDRVAVVLLAATVSTLLVTGAANASMPVLEFQPPGKGFPVPFITKSGLVKAEMADFGAVVQCTGSHGAGTITGPRLTKSQYWFTGCTTEGGSVKCKSSNGAGVEEIISEEIVAELVYINQAKDEVGMLLNPGGGTYMTFACGGEQVVATGSFLALGSPINTETTSFTATLTESQSVQIPDAYESSTGEMLHAIPFGERESHEAVPTGVDATFTIDTGAPITVKAITTAQMEAKQREETRLQEAARTEETITKLREETTADKQSEEALKAQITALEKQLNVTEHKTPTRAQLLVGALKQCKRKPQRKRAQCRAAAERRYGSGTHKDKKR